METNEFLLYNEITCRLHACRSLEELLPTLLEQLHLIISYNYAGIIPVENDPESRDICHGAPLCRPRWFEKVEQAWVENCEASDTLWLSHAVEPTVIWNSEAFTGRDRFSEKTYLDIYGPYHIIDCLQLGICAGGRCLARMAIYRTREDGLFTNRDVFFLRALATHISQAYALCASLGQKRGSGGLSAAALTQRHQLTRRESEILSLVFDGVDNKDIAEKLTISRNTLLKHQQNLYRKCGVSSRWELLQLRDGVRKQNP